MYNTYKGEVKMGNGMELGQCQPNVLIEGYRKNFSHIQIYVKIADIACR